MSGIAIAPGRVRLLSVLLAAALGATACATHVARPDDRPQSSGAAVATPPDAGAAPSAARAPASISATTGAAAPSWLPTLSSFGLEPGTRVFQPGTWSGSLGLNYDSQHQSLRAFDEPETVSRGRSWDTSVTLRNSGFALIDPRLLTGNANLRVSLLPRRSGDEGDGGTRGQVTDYGVSASILPEMPYNALLSASRTQSTSTLNLGGTSQMTNESRGIWLALREDNVLRDKQILPWLSATLYVGQEQSKEETEVAGSRFRRDDQRSVVSVEGHNGFETADLDFRWERAEFVDHLRSDRNHANQRANLSYSLDFGPGLNRRWDSRVLYTARDGDQKISNLAFEQSLSIAHLSNLSSSYSASLNRLQTPSGTVTARGGGVNLEHRLYANLSTSLALNLSQTQLPGGSTSSRGGNLKFSYSHRLPWNGQLSVALGGDTSINENRLPSGSLAVYDAPYQAPPRLGAGAGFLLEDRFVVAETITVVAIKGGARVPTAPGIDYLVVAEGDRTRILPEPGSAIIQPGDRLEISYLFRLDPNIRYRSNSRSVSLAADWEWIGLAISRDRRAEQTLDGAGSFLRSGTTDAATVHTRGAWNDFEAGANATLTRDSGGTIDYRRTELSQHLIYRPSWDWSVGLSANQQRSRFVSPQRETASNSVAATASMTTSGGWIAHATVSRRDARGSDVPSETITDASLRLSRNWTKLSVNIVASLSERLRGDVHSSNRRIHVSLVRQF